MQFQLKCEKKQESVSFLSICITIFRDVVSVHKPVTYILFKEKSKYAIDQLPWLSQHRFLIIWDMQQRIIRQCHCFKDSALFPKKIRPCSWLYLISRYGTLCINTSTYMHIYTTALKKKPHYKSYRTCECCVKTMWKIMLNNHIVLDQAGNVPDTQYCFIRSSFTWDDGKVFLITHFLYLCSGTLKKYS